MRIVPEPEAILAWHFVPLDPQRGPVLVSYDGTEPPTVAPGYVYTTDEPEIKCCRSGLHGSRDPYGALQYAPGPVLCRVRMWGVVDERDEKLASRHREVIWCRDISRELRLYACWCIRQVWPLLTDERSRRAVDVAERHARGEESADELAAACAASWAAARVAARDAARDAARAAAWATARDAAWAAACAASCVSACAAAWDAAWVAARGAQRAEWNRICSEIDREEMARLGVDRG